MIESGNPICFETDSHSIVQKVFKKLDGIGLLNNYTETPKKKFLSDKDMYSHLVLPKIAFGNLKGLKKKVPIYNIKFQLGEKKIDINDPDLIKAFPMVFSQRGGLLSKYHYGIIQNADGTLSIDYHSDKPFIESKQASNSHHNFIKSLNKNTPTLQEQKDFSLSFESREITIPDKSSDDRLHK